MNNKKTVNNYARWLAFSVSSDRTDWQTVIFLEI